MEIEISEFLEFMRGVGCAPADPTRVLADDVERRYRIDGDKSANAIYQLKIENGFGVGRVYNFSTGESHGWTSKTRKDLSPEERKEFRARLAASKKAAERLQSENWARAAKEAAIIWRDSSPAGESEYIVRKGVSPGIGIHYRGKNIIIRAVDADGRITSIQEIFPDGTKLFHPGGRIEDSYSAIAESDDDKSIIVICEGWATGMSIRLATGYPVVVAFNAGNLVAVAEVIRAKYPTARLIIAADNDQWRFRPAKKPKNIIAKDIPGDDARWEEWRIAGVLQNIGIEMAQQAAIRVSAHMIWPEFESAEFGPKPTDFNDLHLLRGLGAVKDRISAAALANTSPLVRSAADHEPPFTHDGGVSGDAPPDWHDEVPFNSYEKEFQELYIVKEKEPEKDWNDLLNYNDKGILKPNNINNIRVLLKHHPVFKNLFCYDEFADEKVVTRAPPWENEKFFSPRSLRDDDVTHIALELEKYGINPNLANIRKIMETVIMDETRNPAKEYFSRLVWDGTKRLDGWLKKYCGCIADDPKYLSAIGRKWMTAAVTRVFRPGCKFDSILILEGPQNIGKSMLLKELATIHGRAYFDDTIKAGDLLSDKIVPKLQGVLIVELAELTGFKRMDKDAAKQIISTTHDRIVRKYANEPISLPRKFVFAASINPKDNEGYLDDPTGNRRYWPAFCTVINHEALRNDKEQLWAEAYELYKAGEQTWLSGDLYKTAEEMQKRRNSVHPWEVEIEEFCFNKTKVTTEDIWKALKIDDMTKRTRQHKEDIGKIMVNIGFEYKQRMQNGFRQQAWYRIETLIQDYQEEEIEWR